VNLDPKTKEIFPQHPTKKEISKKLKKNFSPLITYFTYNEYQNFKNGKITRLFINSSISL
jgi:hypothetical protein